MKPPPQEGGGEPPGRRTVIFSGSCRLDRSGQRCRSEQEQPPTCGTVPESPAEVSPAAPGRLPLQLLEVGRESQS